MAPAGFSSGVSFVRGSERQQPKTAKQATDKTEAKVTMPKKGGERSVRFNAKVKIIKFEKDDSAPLQHDTATHEDL